MSIRVVIADDHRIVREGIRILLDNESGIEVIAEADNGRNAVQIASEMNPDVVVMDITMPDLNGIEATRQILINNPGIKILALSMHSDRRFIAGIIGAGALGYLLKDCSREELILAIRSVASNHIFMSPQIAGIVVEDYIGQLQTNESGSPMLTEREREVLQLIAEGNTINQMSAKLCLSIKTVDSHRRRIMEKLDLHSIAELTKYAIREGMTSL